VLEWALEHPDQTDAMARRAREEFEAKYTAARNYNILMQIYEAAMN
jgi:hypothetical protein